MRFSSTASSLPSTLLSLLFLSGSASLVTATAARSTCLQSKAEDIASAAACGDKDSLIYCFANAPGFVNQATLEQYFLDAGCSAEEAAIEVSWVLPYCDEQTTNGELKRRGPAPAPAPTPGLAAVDVEVLFARQTTAAATTALVCSTATTISTTTCPMQTTGASSGHTSCFSTTVTTSVCASGLICQVDNSGNNICMQRQDNLTTSGAIVAVILVVIVTLLTGSIIFLCCRDKRRDRQMRARAEAAAIAKANALASSSSSAPVGGVGQRPRSLSAVRTPSGAPPVPALPQDPFADGNRLG